MIIGGIFLIVLLGVGFIYYYRCLLKRLFSLFKWENTKTKQYLISFLAIFLGIFTINLFSIIGIFLVHFILISLIIDLLVWLIKKTKVSEKSLFIKIYKTSIVPLILTGLVFTYGYFNIRNVIETKYTIYTDKEIGEDIRVLLITDTHYGTIFKKDKLDEYTKKLNEVKADIVVLGGDIVDESTTKEEMKEVFESLGSIENKYGIYYVYGNHDEQRYSNRVDFTKEELDTTITENNIKILDEQSFSVTENIVIAGRMDNSYGKRKSVKEILGDISSDDYVIMVDHQPIEYQENVASGVDLILSGHTHGGQVFPIKFFINLLHTADLAYGHENIKGMDAVVSSGMAGWGYPIRTQEHSEYTIIDIKEEEK